MTPPQTANPPAGITSGKLMQLAAALRPALGLEGKPGVEIDHELATFAARRHRVGSLLFRACLISGERPSAGVWEFLQREHAINRFAVLRQKATAQKFSQALEKREIPHALVKGWRLGADLYGSAEWRRAKDVDFLVDRNRLADVLIMASEMGFMEKGSRARVDVARAAKILRVHREVSVRDPRTQVEIELHSRLLERPVRGWIDLPLSVSEPCAGARLQCANYVLYLILHGALTGWHRAKWLCDLVMLAKLVTPDVRTDVLKRARALDCLPAVTASFVLAGELWGESAVCSWLGKADVQDHARVTDHLSDFVRRLQQDTQVPLGTRMLRRSGLRRDAPIFGVRTPALRIAIDNVRLWHLWKT